MTSRRRSTAPAVVDRPDPWLTPAAAAVELDTTERTMREWRYVGVGPDFVRIEGRIRYRLSALRAYEESKTVRH